MGDKRCERSLVGKAWLNGEGTRGRLRGVSAAAPTRRNNVRMRWNRQ